MEEMVKALGFNSLDEFTIMVTAVNLEKYVSEFLDWKENDGTKIGLQRILDKEKLCQKQ
jgi:hypothetical protein